VHVAGRRRSGTCANQSLSLPSTAQQVATLHGAGSRFIVCFSSRFDSCSSAIAGVLVDSQRSVPCLDPSSADAAAGGGVAEESGPPSIGASSSSETEGDALVAPRAIPPSRAGTRQATALKKPCRAVSGAHTGFAGGAGGVNVVVASIGSSGGGGGDGGGGSPVCSSGDRDAGHHLGGNVVALLFDEKPKHRLYQSGDTGSGGTANGPRFCGGDGGVHGMRVEEWTEAYGECDGPLLAAWVFPGGGKAVDGDELK